MDFHSFCSPVEVTFERHGALGFNPIDLLFRPLLRGRGLDALHEYFKRYGDGRKEVLPFKPNSIDDDVFLVDFHSHTSLSDGEGTFESILRRLAGKRGHPPVVNGFAFTDHPWHLDTDGKTRIRNWKVVRKSFEGHEVASRLKEKGILPSNFTTFPGSSEFAAAGTSDFPRDSVEIIGLGLPRDFIKDKSHLSRLSCMLAEDLVDEIHGAGGISILPHPFYFEPAGHSRALWEKVDAVEAFNQTTHVFSEPIITSFLDKAPAAVPLVKEVFSLQPLFGYFSWRNRVELGAHPRPVVGSSDAHVECFAGAAATALDAPVSGIDELRASLKRGKSKPMLNPRWEATADLDEIISSVWGHWGKEIVAAIDKVNNEKRGMLPLLKIITSLFRAATARWKRHASR